MKKILFSILASVLLLPSIAFAQFTVQQGGTGLNSITPGQIIFGSSTTLRTGISPNLTFATSTNIFNVIGTASSTSLVVSGSGACSGTSALTTDATGLVSCGVISTGSGIVGSGTTGQFPYYAANGTTLTATSSVFVDTNNFVGISSTTPQAKLSVKGGNSGASGKAFEVTNSSNGNIFVLYDNGTVGFGTSSPFVGTLAGTRGNANEYFTFFNGSSSDFLFSSNNVTGAGSIFRSNIGASALSVQDLSATRIFDVLASGTGGMGTTSPWGRFSIQNASDIPGLVIKANGTQTSDLLALYDSAGTKLASINGSGQTLKVNQSGAAA